VEPLHPLHGSNHDIQHIAELYSESTFSNGSEPRPVVPTKEAEHWVPMASFALAAAFRSRHAPHVSMDAMVDLLAQLNMVRCSKRKSPLPAMSLLSCQSICPASPTAAIMPCR